MKERPTKISEAIKQASAALRMIDDDELQRIAILHGLDNWAFADGNRVGSFMMEGAAIMIRELLNERFIRVELYESGEIELMIGAYAPFRLKLAHRVEKDPMDDYGEDDPIKILWETTDIDLNLIFDEYLWEDRPENAERQEILDALAKSGEKIWW